MFRKGLEHFLKRSVIEDEGSSLPCKGVQLVLCVEDRSLLSFRESRSHALFQNRSFRGSITGKKDLAGLDIYCHGFP